MLRFRSLGSGSSGNATVVEGRCGTQVTRVLVDCGFGMRALAARLGTADLAIADLDAVFITHEHGDHAGGAAALALRAGLPVWMSQGTWDGMGRPDLGDRLRLTASGETIEIGALSLHPFAVPHDTHEPLQLTCSDGATRLGIATDLGHVTGTVLAALAGCAALLLECNHDPQLLAESRYPPFLKRRVGGAHGHLANAQAAQALDLLNHAGLRHVVAAHLSEKNNTPPLARGALAAVLGCADEEIGVADPLQGTPWLQA